MVVHQCIFISLAASQCIFISLAASQCILISFIFGGVPVHLYIFYLWRRVSASLLFSSLAACQCIIMSLAECQCIFISLIFGGGPVHLFIFYLRWRTSASLYLWWRASASAHCLRAANVLELEAYAAQQGPDERIPHNGLEEERGKTGGFKISTMCTRCYCALPLFAFAHRLHTRRAHATPTKPHFLHVLLSCTTSTHERTTIPRNPISFAVISQIQILYTAQEGNIPTSSIFGKRCKQALACASMFILPRHRQAVACAPISILPRRRQAVACASIFILPRRRQAVACAYVFFSS